MPSGPPRDVWLGVTKSALQKYVRRGETALALQAAAELIRLDKRVFFWRWPIIVAEDVLTAVPLLPFVADNPLGVVEATTTLPKNKDAWGLYVLARDSAPLGRPSCALVDALVAADAVLATRCAWWEWEMGHKDAVINELSGMLLGTDGVAVRDLLTAATKIRKGPGPEDCQPRFMVAAAVLCALDQVASAPKEIRVREAPAVTAEAVLPPHHVRWYACDQHTAPGGGAMRAVAKYAPSVTMDKLKAIWFWNESAKLGGGVADHRFYSEDESMRAEGLDPYAARARWYALKDHAIELVGLACAKWQMTAVR